MRTLVRLPSCAAPSVVTKTAAPAPAEPANVQPAHINTGTATVDAGAATTPSRWQNLAGMGGRKWAPLGMLAGGALGALMPGKDEDGERRSALTGALRGAAAGGLAFGLGGAAVKRMWGPKGVAGNIQAATQGAEQLHGARLGQSGSEFKQTLEHGAQHAATQAYLDQLATSANVGGIRRSAGTLAHTLGFPGMAAWLMGSRRLVPGTSTPAVLHAPVHLQTAHAADRVLHAPVPEPVGQTASGHSYVSGGPAAQAHTGPAAQAPAAQAPTGPAAQAHAGPAAQAPAGPAGPAAQAPAGPAAQAPAGPAAQAPAGPAAQAPAGPAAQAPAGPAAQAPAGPAAQAPAGPAAQAPAGPAAQAPAGPAAQAPAGPAGPAAQDPAGPPNTAPIGHLAGDVAAAATPHLIPKGQHVGLRTNANNVPQHHLQAMIRSGMWKYDPATATLIKIASPAPVVSPIDVFAPLRKTAAKARPFSAPKPTVAERVQGAFAPRKSKEDHAPVAADVKPAANPEPAAKPDEKPKAEEAKSDKTAATVAEPPKAAEQPKVAEAAAPAPAAEPAAEPAKEAEVIPVVKLAALGA